MFMWKKISVALFSLLALVSVSAANAEVARAIVTTAVVDREPVSDLTTIPATDSSAIFFTELRDMEGKTVTHLWKFNGEVMAEVKFNVGGPRWRVWSSKNLMPEWYGEWIVDVVDDAGTVLTEKNFVYEAAMAEAPAEEMTGDAPMGSGASMSEPAAAPDEEMKQGQ
jgi:hypothetical protein